VGAGVRKEMALGALPDMHGSVKPEVLAQNATLMALAAYWIADRPERLRHPGQRKRQPRC